MHINMVGKNVATRLFTSNEHKLFHIFLQCCWKVRWCERIGKKKFHPPTQRRIRHTDCSDDENGKFLCSQFSTFHHSSFSHFRVAYVAKEYLKVWWKIDYFMWTWADIRTGASEKKLTCVAYLKISITKRQMSERRTRKMNEKIEVDYQARAEFSNRRARGEFTLWNSTIFQLTLMTTFTQRAAIFSCQLHM